MPSSRQAAEQICNSEQHRGLGVSGVLCLGFRALGVESMMTCVQGSCSLRNLVLYQLSLCVLHSDVGLTLGVLQFSACWKRESGALCDMFVWETSVHVGGVINHAAQPVLLYSIFAE